MLNTPRRIGPWRVVRVLGIGGMGTVFQAHRGNRHVALKVLSAHLQDDAKLRQRFRREAALAQLVDSPYVARHVASDLDGTPGWIASELIEGPTLLERVKEEPFKEREWLDLAEGLLVGLKHIHESGVLHRDIKPANILLSDRGPVYVDFGIAAAADLTSLTTTGGVVGSVGWISPEQLSGKPASPASDIFAVGATLAYATTGTPSFGGGTVDEVLHRVRNSPPNLEGVPKTWRALLSAMLAKDSAERPDAATVLVELRAIKRLAALSAAGQATVHRGDGTKVLGIGGNATAPLQTRDLTARGLSRTRGEGLKVPLTLLLALAVLIAAGLGAFWWGQAPSKVDEASAGTTAPTAPVHTAPAPAAPAAPAAPPAPAPTGTVIQREPQSDAETEGEAASPDKKEVDPVLTAVPKFSGTVLPHRVKSLNKLGDFLLDHVQEVVILDVDFVIAEGASLEASGNSFVARGRCDTVCVGILGLYVKGLEDVPEAVVSGNDHMGAVVGTFAILSADVGAGAFEVSLRALPLGSTMLPSG